MLPMQPFRLPINFKIPLVKHTLVEHLIVSVRDLRATLGIFFQQPLMVKVFKRHELNLLPKIKM